MCASTHSAHPENGSLALFLPCATSPHSGRKSDAQRPFPSIQDAQSHACTIPMSALKNKQTNKHKNITTMHRLWCTAPMHEAHNTPAAALSACFFSGYVTHPSHHESRLGERRVAALNDRCLLSALQVSRSDPPGQEGFAVMSIQWQMVRTKPVRIVQLKNNSHHLSVFTDFQAQ